MTVSLLLRLAQVANYLSARPKAHVVQRAGSGVISSGDEMRSPISGAVFELLQCSTLHCRLGRKNSQPNADRRKSSRSLPRCASPASLFWPSSSTTTTTFNTSHPRCPAEQEAFTAASSSLPQSPSSPHLLKLSQLPPHRRTMFLLPRSSSQQISYPPRQRMYRPPPQRLTHQVPQGKPQPVFLSFCSVVPVQLVIHTPHPCYLRPLCRDLNSSLRAPQDGPPVSLLRQCAVTLLRRSILFRLDSLQERQLRLLPVSPQLLLSQAPQ